MFRFNNCHKRDHANLYGRSDAFFDLDMFDSQAKVAERLSRELNIGDICIVATPDIPGDLTCDITFDLYEFSGAKIMHDRERRVDCHVYFGKHIKPETLSRADAIRHRVYKNFFNVNGHFKRRSVQRAN